MGKWWEKKKEVATIWQALKTNDGLDYYFNTVTNETSWDKPEELMTDEEKDSAGDWQWIPDKENAFIPAKKISETGAFSNVVTENGREMKIKTKEMFPLKKSSLQRVPEDLVLLDSMSGPLILHCLKERFMQNLIYTNVGTILISVNPYQMLPIYTRAIVEKYMYRGVSEMPPHVFNIAHDAFKGLDFGVNHSIIISGESGAGKTEATKRCLAYIAAIAGSVGGVEKKVLQANPILEAFGNAKTVRNDNSSRFGKYMELFFTDGDGRIAGSQTTNYLLEKIRVVQQAPQERNYHIFYQLCKCAETRKKYKLGNCANYNYLTGGGCIDVSTIDDGREFADVESAWKDLDFKTDEVDNIYKVVSGVLILGNVELKGAKVRVNNQPVLDQVASQLAIPPKVLARALTIRELRIRGQPPTDVALNEAQASDARHALAKFIYGSLFDWLVKKINIAMGDKFSRGKSVGLLDIFGFEIFEHNSFEQLCINFTNEMLQQHFNQQTFKLEEQVYKQEKIKFQKVSFVDNVPMIELITKKPDGILPLLDEELRVPKGSDKGFVGKLHERQGKNKVYKRFLKNPDFFIVKHYAGDVVYDTQNFLEKNRDTLTMDLLEAVMQSKNKLLNVLFPPKMDTTKVDKKKSLGKQFVEQLTTLMSCLNKTEPHYIRCVKPNAHKGKSGEASSFSPGMCYEQLMYSGVFEAVAIRKQGFPFRMKHDAFAQRYGILVGGGGSGKGGCEKVIDGMKLKRENVQMGSTMVLYRAEEHKKLELDRSIKVMTKTINEKLEKLCNTSTSSMDKAGKEEYFDQLAHGVRQADEFRLKTPYAEKARKLLDEYIEARMDPRTKSLLENALKTKLKEDIEKALSEAALHGYRTSLTRKCSELLEKVQDAEDALAASMDHCSVDMLERSLQMCDEFQYNSETVQQARTMLEAIQTAISILTAAQESKDHLELKSGLDSADSVGFTDSLIEACRSLYQKVLTTRAALEEALSRVDESMLEAALWTADSFAYNAQLVYDARGLYQRTKRINEEAKLAYGTLEEDHVRTCLEAADGIGMNTEFINYFRDLVNGPYADFVDKQAKKAVENANHDRAIRLNIKAKDIWVQEKGSMFSLDKFQNLKHPLSEWAKEKGIFGNKEQIAQNMLKWQKPIIHRELTKLINEGVSDPKKFKQLKKLCRTSHETVQKFMGQRKSKKTPIRAVELLKNALENKEIRNETYIHILKQMDTNTHPETNDKAWELMALCLSTFPPGDTFENYLEVHFRSSQWSSAASRWKCKGLLRRICHQTHVQNMRMNVPTESDVMNVAGFMSSRLNGFDDPPLSTSYNDLKEPYQGSYGGGGYGGGGGGGGYDAGAAAGGGYAQEEYAAAPAAAEPAGDAGDWTAILEETSGDTYYYNNKTGESTWEAPPGFY